MPVLDGWIPPNTVYHQSPFLFWSIVYVGCRRYADDPTLLGFLAPRITNLALCSLATRQPPIHVIQGLLFLCTWPVPIPSAIKDISHVLAGAAMRFSMQIGLHTIGVGQDFEKTKVAADQNEIAMRARLWLSCLRVCQT